VFACAKSKSFALVWLNTQWIFADGENAGCVVTGDVVIAF
jgi:hypothetical protein